MKKILLIVPFLILLTSCIPPVNHLNMNTNEVNMNQNATPCPQYAQPPPGWCSDGVIVPQGTDEHGCQLPATCEQATANQNMNTFSVVRKEGEMCGGIAGLQCEEGLTCQYNGNYPDASGVCVQEEGTIPFITAEELEQGWYWGMVNQRKPGTPQNWVWVDAGRSSKWMKPPNVMSFEECILYYPVLESYPRQCRTPDGTTYVEQINVNATSPTGHVSTINELCGGFANRPCGKGLECIYGPKGSDVGTCAKPNPNKNGNCIQVLASAKDPRTGECWTFSTPCDVPVGWETCIMK